MRLLKTFIRNIIYLEKIKNNRTSKVYRRV